MLWAPFEPVDVVAVNHDTGQANALCGDDVTKFHHIEGRFSSPVMPGDALTIRAWRTGDGQAVFTTSVGDRVVIDQGLVRFS